MGYSKLKIQYGKEIAEIWPEVTDPQKFVYEDVAIASYLLVLWEEERNRTGNDKKQSFLDIGCGNGLLVHILSSEGHPGKGIDLRRRKIWSIYGENTDLEENIVTPESIDVVKGYDWLLGNPSDELTPWIPVLAARSSPNTRFWVLPCCFFNFYSKYERKQSSHGQYHNYLGFISHISVECGYDVQVDVMRIPSTKRVCLIGGSKTHSKCERPAVLDNITKRISTEKRKSASNTSVLFVPREKLEKVKNCTKIDRKVQQQFVMTIVEKLLEIPTTPVENIVSDDDRPVWRKGCKLKLSQAALLFDESKRKHLKAECGGLQTLLRNFNQVFVVRNGEVEIRDWRLPEHQHKINKVGRKRSLSETRKTRTCWFYQYHPDGCPLTETACSFSHVVIDTNT